MMLSAIPKGALRFGCGSTIKDGVFRLPQQVSRTKGSHFRYTLNRFINEAQ
jgi:hypothetical protein